MDPGLHRVPQYTAALRDRVDRGYARIDFRVDANDNAFVIDINANPGLGPDAGFVAAAAQAGIDFDALTELLLRAAGTGAARQPATLRHAG